MLTGRPRSFTDEQLSAACAIAISYTQIHELLGLKSRGGSATSSVRKRIVELGIETPNLIGISGKSHKPIVRSNRKKFEDLTSNHSFPRRMISAGVPYLCAICGISEWLGKKLVLQADHIDGDTSNNKFENLRFLCPNCHSQTETFCGRNIRLRRLKKQGVVET